MKACSVLTIAGSDSGGGAGVQADIKTFAAHKVHGVCAITAVTAQNTLGVQKVFPLPEDVVAEQLESILSDFNIVFAKTGMLHNPGTIRVANEYLERYGVPYVVDPVMSAEAGGSLLSPDALSALEDLIRGAFAVTPNIFEAEALTGIKINGIDDAKTAATALCRLGASSALITGGHLEGRDVVLHDNCFREIGGALIKGGTHGAGCTYSAALSASLARGIDIFQAARNAKKFVTEAIASSNKTGAGVAPVNQLQGVVECSERFRVIENLSRAIRKLQECELCAVLVPEVGCNLAMATPGATSVDDVAAVEGRMVRLRNRVHPVGSISFGASSHMARIILSSMRFDSTLLSAMNIRCAPEIIDACENLGLTIASFSRENEPPESNTMDWGTTYAFEHAVDNPSKEAGCSNTSLDVIYDEGGVGKEAMVRLLGQDACSVARRAISIAEIVAQ